MPRDGESDQETRYRDRNKPGGYKYKAQKEEGQGEQGNQLEKKDFWEQLAIEWVDTKENMRQNDKFMKETMAPAFKTYQDRLSGVSNEPGFKPINMKFGDFQTSIMPRQAQQNAEAMFRSQIGEAELNQPKNAEMGYLDRLMQVGMFDREIERRNDASKRANKRDDSGSFMDAISDTIGVGAAGSNLWKMWS